MNNLNIEVNLVVQIIKVMIMDALKYFFITIGIISILLFLTLLIIGVKVVSAIFLYIVGTIAVISLIGFIIFYLGKLSGRKQSK